jgi:hypothetical protein
MFAAGANLAQADEFSFDRAEWRSNSNLLVYEGHGAQGSSVEAYISRTLVSLGRARVDSEGRWIFTFSDPDSIPCRVRIETSTYSGERDVSNAPSGCINQDNLSDTNSQSEPEPQGGTFRFARSRYNVDEGDTVTLTVIRSNSSGQANLNVGTRGVSARNRQDYNGYAWSAINFQDGESRKTVRISTLTDNVAESNETFRVVMGAPSDGYSLTSPNTSVVTINDAAVSNNAPVIRGTPSQHVAVGEDYAFRPTASDADNDNLTFSVENLPNWARFNTTNGALSGTPTDDDAGRYNNIVITVSDGTDTASLSPFNLTVDADTLPTTGNIALSWVAPSTRFDGTALSLSDIAGYRIYMGTSANSLAPVLDLEDGTLDRHVMENLDSGTYYFAITAYDTSGSESDLSNIVERETM